ncbi:predicted protein [Histoplasma capsulatum G186AR]|uniref:Uncharacterized protein n=1 Tax=Ajellomyces capsulatus (strain G186AR / H82 / ATCC MYA-2454 / RMSCC 2432) TaxID=447093 RepID=C0NQF0_AJECG|nr:uncharacterized protein HCBG_05738 [Histoplasma capsulatum G186AR]EEH06422.1 predicted protein [Histoplasma capsulatum G186AR]
MRMSQSRPSGIPPTRLVVPKSLSPLDLAQEWIPRWRFETHGSHGSGDATNFVVSGVVCSELRHEGINRLIKTNSIQQYRSLCSMPMQSLISQSGPDRLFSAERCWLWVEQLETSD